MRSIVLRIHAEIDDDVVACVFTLSIQSVAGQPEQRVEPVNQARDLCKHLKQPISAMHVGQFMCNNDSLLFVRPVIGAFRKNHSWMNNSPGHWHAVMNALQDANRSPGSEFVRNLTRHQTDYWIRDRLCAQSPLPPADEAGQKDNGACNKSRKPQNPPDSRHRRYGRLESLCMKGDARRL